MEFYPGKGDEKEEAAVGLQENDSTSFLLQVVFNEHFKVRTQFELESTTVVPVKDDRRKQVRKERRIIQQRRNHRQLAWSHDYVEHTEDQKWECFRKSPESAEDPESVTPARHLYQRRQPVSVQV